MYTLAERDAASDHVLAMARADPRIVAAAAVGSLATGPGDRWSDLDLSFAVADGTPVQAVLDDWTERVVAELDAAVLFDLQAPPIIYRVFLLPGCLQVDLSFTPAAQFGPAGPRWRLLFGSELPPRTPAAPSAHELFGYAAVYARDARACIARGRLWQAEHAVSALRDNALALACLRRGLPARFGRGYDDLPAEVLTAFDAALVRSLDAASLMAALAAAVDGLLRESGLVAELAATVGPRLRELLDD